MLLLLVFGAFLVIVGATASGQAMLVTAKLAAASDACPRVTGSDAPASTVAAGEHASFATAAVAPASTPVPASPVPARVIPVASSVGTRPASTGLIVSEISPERPVTVAVAATRVGAAQLAWLVPGLVLGLPGVLLIAIVTAQVLGAAAFLGLTRRTLGGLGVDTQPRQADREAFQLIAR